MTTTQKSQMFAVHKGPELMGLAQWNVERSLYWEAVRERVQHPEMFCNGLKCPQCSHGNLYDRGPVTQGSPVMVLVKCKNCAYKGERFE